MKAVKRFGVWLLGMLLLSGCSSQPVQEPEPMNRNCFAMNTYISFTIYTDVPESVLDTVEAEIKDLESLWSVTDEGSEVYRIDRRLGKLLYCRRNLSGFTYSCHKAVNRKWR